MTLCPSRPARFAVMGLTTFALTACASNATQSPNIASAVLRNIATAKTPEQFCASLTLGFATYLGDGSRARCADDLPVSFPSWPHGRASVDQTRHVRDQIAVTATIHPQFTRPTDIYLVKVRGTWRLNSVGKYVRLGA